MSTSSLALRAIQDTLQLAANIAGRASEEHDDTEFAASFVRLRDRLLTFREGDPALLGVARGVRDQRNSLSDGTPVEDIIAELKEVKAALASSQSRLRSVRHIVTTGRASEMRARLKEFFSDRPTKD